MRRDCPVPLHPDQVRDDPVKESAKKWGSWYTVGRGGQKRSGLLSCHCPQDLPRFFPDSSGILPELTRAEKAAGSDLAVVCEEQSDRQR
jgi:hypothetical protein